MHVIGYRRVSTQEQASSGHSLDAQRDAIAEHAARKGWTVDWRADEGATGSKVNPGLREALELLRTKQADALVVTKMDRIARSVYNAADVMQAAQDQGWSLIVLDLGMDLSTPSGKAMAQMLSVFAELELEMIRSRTRDGLATAKAKGKQLGRPSGIPADVRRRIVQEREEGRSFASIATDLSVAGVLSPTGRTTWHESVVRRAYGKARSS
ncbi:recombinase family protein [Aeromicrobium endophyticum]|uniref:Recombinase RecB n=1 Tax=Aeromicrobium endophyticum TaxID=2292704 RepID=A0A371P9G7_9ACTN|nr:recombinase family protein [Aeromicrobium endophyticum]REK72136.1 recombinase RecB [Aeromicrobium endophyticum]